MADQSLLLLLLLAVAAALWQAGMRARETALLAARRACERNGVLLLDETVVLRRLGLGRDPGGRLRWRRGYDFEFALDALARRSGSIELLGRRVTHLHLELPEYTLFEE